MEWKMTKQPKQTEGKAGRRETLTQDLAKKIANLILHFPDSDIEVTWKNVIEQVKRRYGIKFHRNTLSQKEWDGQKLIAIAFDDAEAVQKRLVKEKAPKYADNPRSRLRLIIAKLQAENLALREQLAKVRAQQYDEAFSLLDLRTPLHQLVDGKARQLQGKSGDRRSSTETTLSLVSENAAPTGRQVSVQSNAARKLPNSKSSND